MTDDRLSGDAATNQLVKSLDVRPSGSIHARIARQKLQIPSKLVRGVNMVLDSSQYACHPWFVVALVVVGDGGCDCRGLHELAGASQHWCRLQRQTQYNENVTFAPWHHFAPHTILQHKSMEGK